MSNHCVKNWSSCAWQPALWFGSHWWKTFSSCASVIEPPPKSARICLIAPSQRSEAGLDAEAPRICRSARYAVPGRVYVLDVVNRVPTVGFEGAPVQNVVLVVP